MLPDILNIDNVFLNLRLKSELREGEKSYFHKWAQNMSPWSKNLLGMVI